MQNTLHNVKWVQSRRKVMRQKRFTEARLSVCIKREISRRRALHSGYSIEFSEMANGDDNKL